MSFLRESQTVELKRELTNDIKKEIVAFANTSGGKIYIGIEDDGSIVGVQDAKGTAEAVGNMIRDAIKPDITAYTAISIHRMEQHDIVVVSVMQGAKRPYHLADKGLKPSGVFFRHGIASAPASDGMIRAMLRDSDNLRFESSRAFHQKLIFSYAEEVFKQKNIDFQTSQKRTLGIIDSDGYYTNLGLLLSDQCTHTIKCAVYEGTNKTEFKDRREFGGSILKQCVDVFEYLQLHNMTRGEIKGLERIENKSYPDFALREALLNAVVHRDYDFRGSILIHIFTDRIEFVSLGGLVSGLTMNDIMLGVSESRNPDLAAVYYRLHLIESYGTGIQRILEGYRGYHRQPAFNSAENSFAVILPRKAEEKEQFVKESQVFYTDEDLIIDYIARHGYVTRRAVEEILGLKTTAASGLLKKLCSKGEIAVSGGGRSTKYYRARKEK